MEVAVKVVNEKNVKGMDYIWLALTAFGGLGEYYGAAEPPVRCGVSHLSGQTEPPV